MIAARYRFHGHGSLKFLHKHAQVIRSRYFTVKAVTNPHRKHSRFAVIVSKKVHKSAVGRNRIRRRMYELIRTTSPHITQTVDVAVIITSGETLAAPYDDLRESLLGQLRELGIYHE